MAPGSSQLIKLAMGHLKRFTSPRGKASTLRKDRGETSVVRDLESVVRTVVIGGCQAGCQAEGEW